MMTPDLVVIGGGSAGIGAARAARSRGASVLLVERSGRIGGDCTFTGCVPSKALIEAAERGDGFGDAMDAARRAIETVAATETADVLRSEGIDVARAEATFVGPQRLRVDGTPVETGAFVIATGARPAVPPIAGIDTVDVLTSDTVFGLDELPESLAVLGGGPIGSELAQAFARLGSAVTLIEASERLLPREEPVASSVIHAALNASGVDVRVGSPVARVERADAGRGVRLHLGDGSVVAAHRLLVAVGRSPSTAGLGLDAAGVGLDRDGFVVVDDRLRTSARNVYAAGDVALRLQFTHVAFETGRIAARNALSPVPFRRFAGDAVPWVTFTGPEVARVGLTEADAAGRGARVAFLPMREVDRAVTAGQTEGFVKLVVGPRQVLRGTAGGRILGATVVAARAGEMIHEVVLAMRSGMFPARLALATHAYPTWSAAIQQVAAQLFGEFGGRTARPASAGPVDPEEAASALGRFGDA